jgi:DNA-binding GntR family transcriptional regulator
MYSERTGRAEVEIDRSSLTSKIAARLREEILAGGHMYGDPLMLVPLASQFGVSITPIRRALNILREQGLVETPQRYGSAIVTYRSGETVQLAYEISARVQRRITEYAGAELSAQSIDEIELLDRELRAADCAGDPRAARCLEHAIHRLVILAGASSVMKSLVDSTMTLMTWRVPPDVPGWATIRASGHADIIQALRRRDPAKAGSLMEAHILDLGRAAAKFVVATQDAVHIW